MDVRGMIRVVIVCVILGVRACLAAETDTVVSTKVTSGTGNKTNDGLSKRGIKQGDLSRKSYNDPPPEYYRGPGSSYTGNRGTFRPVAFPGESYAANERKGLNDRVSVGHYSSTSASTHGGYGSHTTAHPYGPPQAIEYEYYGPPSGHSHAYTESNEGIPIELYNRGYGGYGHDGDEYSAYTVSTGHGNGHGYGGHGGYHSGKHGYDKALLAKSFLIPLASAAVLGIAAALASNPLLLQLGTVSTVGKRRRRAIRSGDRAQLMAYRSRRRN